jgi:hypothetical protein
MRQGRRSGADWVFSDIEGKGIVSAEGKEKEVTNQVLRCCTTSYLTAPLVPPAAYESKSSEIEISQSLQTEGFAVRKS